ncbi:MAG: hypothetical protein Q7J68_00225 [Thermoplasmata archaeon]|nr:hypothetical protein [Thermoplasmata archaeon]
MRGIPCDLPGKGYYMAFKNKLLALTFTVMFILTILVLPAPVEGAVTNLELVPGKYTGNNTYVPGETISIIVAGDTEGEKFAIYSVINGENLIPGGNIQIPASGSVKVSYEVPSDVPDGNYLLRVKRPNEAVEAETNFSVQGYVFKIETDRNAYLSSDEIRVFWTANNLKDQTLPATGIGKIDIWMIDPNLGNLGRIVEAYRFNVSAGSVAFKLPMIDNYTRIFFVDGWFNSSSTAPLRSQYSKADFSIKRLGVIITMDKNQYAAGSLMRLSVRTLATDNPANPSITETAEPECNVTISIKKIGDIQPTYPPITLKTDSQGVLNHIIPLNNETYVDGAFFEVEIYAYKGTNSISDSQSFEIVSSSSISIVLNFNRAQYASSETLFVNATASAIGDVTSTTFTYILEIRALSSNGSLFARDTQTHGNFSFAIPGNFEGLLWIRVTGDDGAGNSASVIQQVSVAYALVLVNLDRDYYNQNDRLSISYSIIGTMIGTPSTFYVVYDNEGNVVEEGVTQGGIFTFDVPVAPSSKYGFTVFASAGGRVVQGTDSAFLFSGYLLNLEFNRGYYGPGDTIAVNYDIIILGNANMPATFTITYGLINGPVSSLQTTETSGTLIYTIPKDIDEGVQIFMASCNFGATQASSSEILLVKSDANPLWFLKISDIPVFSIGLLLIVLFSLYISYRTRKRIKHMEKEGVIKPTGLAELTMPKRAQDSSLHQVECVECGNPIEITTSRRPIEVMCPHCGEIQHIE